MLMFNCQICGTPLDRDTRCAVLRRTCSIRCRVAKHRADRYLRGRLRAMPAQIAAHPDVAEGVRLYCALRRTGGAA